MPVTLAGGFSTGASLKRIPPALQIEGKKRYVKKCLSVGRWLAWPGAPDPYWTVTLQTLDQIERNFAEQTAAGFKRWLRWNHGSDAESVESLIYHTFAEGESLYCGVYLTDAEYESIKDIDTSVHVVRNFGTQEGQVWPGYSLIHLALVQDATVPGQDEFIQLNAKTDQPPEEQMDFASIVEQLNRLIRFINPDAEVPTSGENAANPDTLIPILIPLVDSLIGNDKNDQTPDTLQEPEMDQAQLNAKIAEAFDAMFKPAVEKFTGAVEQATASLSAKIAETSRNAAETEFRSKVAAKLKAGCPSGICDEVISLGAKLDWNPDLLGMLDKAAPIKQGSQIGKLASDAPETVGDGIGDEERSRARKLLGLN